MANPGQLHHKALTGHPSGILGRLSMLELASNARGGCQDFTSTGSGLTKNNSCIAQMVQVMLLKMELKLFQT